MSETSDYRVFVFVLAQVSENAEPEAGIKY